MIEHTIAAALASPSVSHVVVSTDDDEIEEVALRSGATAFRHPTALSADDAPTFPVIRWATENAQRLGLDHTVCATLRPTTPFRSSCDVEEAIGMLRLHPKADSLVSVVELAGAHPKRLKHIEKGWLVDAYEMEGPWPSRRQNLEPVYIRNGGIYLAKPEIILSGRLWGQWCLAYVMPQERSLNINSEYDFLVAELLSQGAARPLG